MNRIGIFGTSGMAREAGDIAYALGLEPVYVARDKAEMDAYELRDQVMLESDVDQNHDMGYAIGIGDNSIRQRIAQRYGSRVRFVNLIHPSASFGWRQRDVVEAARGVIVCAGVRFTNNIKVGDFCILNLNTTVSHDVVIDDFVYVSPGVHINGNVHLSIRTWVGSGAVFKHGEAGSKLYIGPDTVIGAGAVVVNNCDSNAIYAGIPAKRIK